MSQLQVEIPRYEIFNGGNDHKSTPLYEYLWNHHLFKIRQWKEEDKQRKQVLDSRNTSDVKSTAVSEKRQKTSKSDKKRQMTSKNVKKCQSPKIMKM